MLSARVYRRAHALRAESTGCAVLVQKMLEPAVSGVGFTINPVTGHDGEVWITASWGLGEAVVGGHTDPDEFRFRKSDGTILAARVGAKRHRVVADGAEIRLVDSGEPCDRPSLDNERLKQLFRLMVRVERLFGAPQDVEWCFDGVGFWMLQSRPTTTGHPLPATGHPLPAGIEWTRANLREVLPDLASPLTLTLVSDWLNRASRAYYGKLLAPESSLGPVVRPFQGRLYFNLSQLRFTCRLSSIPAAAMLRAIGHEESIRPEDETVERPDLAQFVAAVPDLCRLVLMQLRIRRLIERRLAFIRDDYDYLSEPDPRTLSDAALWSTLIRGQGRAVEYLPAVMAAASVTTFERPPPRDLLQIGIRLRAPGPCLSGTGGEIGLRAAGTGSVGARCSGPARGTGPTVLLRGRIPDRIRDSPRRHPIPGTLRIVLGSVRSSRHLRVRRGDAPLP